MISPHRGAEEEPTAQQGRSERETATARLLTAYREEGDTRARDRLVQLYLPLVEAFAHRYGGHRARAGAEHEDLVQAGSIGLLNAIDRFDPKRGEEFAAFAVPTIAGEIKRHLRDRTETVRLPRRLREASVRLPRAREQLTARLGRSPEPRELAAELGVEVDEVAALEETGTPGADEEAAVEEALDDRILLADAFRALDETERTVVYLRFVRELSRRETAKQMGISEDRLRALTKAALAKLRGELEGRAFRTAASEPAKEADTAPPEAARAAASEASPAAEPTEAAAEPGPAAAGEAGPQPPAADASEPAPAAQPRSGRLLVRMPPALHDELARAAERDQVSLNQYITSALSHVLGERTSQGERRQVPRWLPAAIVTNIVILAVTGIVALVLLLIALDRGL